MTSYRLPAGGRIDRNRPIAFTWAGRRLTGFAGDTLASALLANGISTVGRSFKYHRRRGIMAAGLEEANAIVQLETGAHTLPNLKATQIELYDGLHAAPVNAWPGLELDALALNGAIKRFIPAAFYYKTFMWPGWRWFEPAIRRAAGLGRAPTAPDPDTYAHRFAHCETLVVGAGLSGLAAAIRAAQDGGRVLIVEAEPEPGGASLWSGEDRARDALLAQLRSYPNAVIHTRTTAFGYYDDNLVGLCERLTDHIAPAGRAGPRQRLWKVRAGRVVLATGAFERPLAFAANDLPGIMLASAAHAYLGRFGIAPGRRVVIATNNASVYPLAGALRAAGVEVAAIVDSRGTNEAPDALAGCAPLRAHGRRQISAVTVGTPGGERKQTIACDALLMSGGWSPAVHLHSQAGGTLTYDQASQSFVPRPDAAAPLSVGAAAGSADAVGPIHLFADGDRAADQAWIDFQNDVTVGDLHLAARENFRSVEHVKRYTTLGMASDQGKTSNVPAIQQLAGLLGRTPPQIGTTRFRPPYDPVAIGAFAGTAVGRRLMPAQLTPSHDLATCAGARFEDYGAWRRPSSFALPGESEPDAVAREVLAVRHHVGLFDASPLGKIEVAGPDAAEFLDRIYVNRMATLKPGRLRYGLMLTENGVIFDDGVCARLDDHRFIVGTTSGHARAVTQMLEEWLQGEWPDLRVVTENVTTCWSVMNIAGPSARALLAAVGTDIDLSSEAFPHMAIRCGMVGGMTGRVQRVSFTGELSYEIAVPWHSGAALWSALLEAGKAFGIAPFGVEALMTMRIEKGFLHVGSETDGTTLPQDVGFAAAVAAKPGDFVGRRSTMRPDALRPRRRQLVGLEVEGAVPSLPVGAHVVDHGSRGRSAGWVTSSAWSPTLGRSIALAMIEAGTERIGEVVTLWDLGPRRSARICDPRFYDPRGERLDG